MTFGKQKPFLPLALSALLLTGLIGESALPGFAQVKNYRDGDSMNGRPVIMPKASDMMKGGGSGSTSMDGDQASDKPEAGFQDVGFSPSTSKKRVFIFTTDFPQDNFAQYPSPPLAETKFWQLLNTAMSSTNDLALTTDPTVADYRVEIRCGGIRRCSQLVIDVKTPDRNPLTSFKIMDAATFWGQPKLELVTHELSQRLDERIRMLPQGGYGYHEDEVQHQPEK